MQRRATQEDNNEFDGDFYNPTTIGQKRRQKTVQKTALYVLALCVCLFIAACNRSVLPQNGNGAAAATSVEAATESSPAESSNSEADGTMTESPPADTATPESAPTEPAPAEAAPTEAAPTEPVPTEPAPTPTEPPPSALFYNMPPAILTSATGLYASPNRAEFIVPVTIPQGETIYVMGRNATSSHLRTVWNTGVGWVPVSFTDYNGQREKLADLPVFEQEPPACAIPVTTQFGFSSQWTSDQRQRIAVVADLFRSKYGQFPDSSLSLTVNGFEVESSRRPIVENGQFSLKDVVFSPGQDLQAGETVGYLLNTTSDEPLTFMATIFSIPQNCQWEID